MTQEPAEMNTEKTTKIPVDQMLIAGAFILALVLRLLRLVQAPLTDSEATLALQALGLANGNYTGAIVGQPGYILPTAALFAIFHGGSGIARLIPTLAGSGIVLIPLFFKKELGSFPAILLAFGLALDPGLTALSRQASGVTWAVFFSLLAVVGVVMKKPVLAGLSLGLAVLGGLQFWQGLLGAGLGFILYRLLTKQKNGADQKIGSDQPVYTSVHWRKVLFWFLVGLLAGGTMFLFFPRGISAAGSGLVDYLSGWLHLNSEPIFKLGLAVGAYELFVLIFAIVQIARVLISREYQPIDLALICWLVFALLLALIYPSRSEAGLAWAVIPMWGLAVRWLAEIIPLKESENPLIIIGQAAFLFILGIFAWFSFIGLLDLSKAPEIISMRWIGLAGAFVLAFGGIILFRWGWPGLSLRGIPWAIIGLLLIWNLSSVLGAAWFGRHPETQLWRTGAAMIDEDLLMKSIGDASEWNTGRRDSLDLAVVNITSPALRWALRDYLTVSYYDVNPVGSTPSMVLTDQQSSPALAESYRGQDFMWASQPDWQIMTANDWLNWLVYKKAPLKSDTLILWVRTDRFPGGVQTP